MEGGVGERWVVDIFGEMGWWRLEFVEEVCGGFWVVGGGGCFGGEWDLR